MPRPPSRADGAPDRGFAGISILLASVLALTAGVVAFGFMVAQPRVRVAGAGESAAAAGLVLSAQRAGWVAHGGPMAGMPMGAPGDMPAEGHRRLNVEVLVTNDSHQPIAVTPDSFRLVAQRGEWAPQRATLPGSELLEGRSLLGDLYFEVPDDVAAEGGLSLRLIRGRDRVLVVLPLSGDEADHERSTH